MEKMKMKMPESEAITNTSWGLSFPLHIVSIILSKLSIFCLPSCRQVCKSWNHLILDSSPKFIPNSFLYFPTRLRCLDFPDSEIRAFDIDTLNFVASCKLNGPLHSYTYCNGLLFIDRSDNIFNPMTNEFFKPPSCKLSHPLFNGFGFSPITKEYKLFRMDLRGNMKVLRFGKNLNQWTIVRLPTRIFIQSHGAYMNGVIYWAERKNDEYNIQALDVETEKFEVIGVLDVGNCYFSPILKPFNGTIYVIAFEPFQIIVWRMKRKNCWTRDFINLNLLGNFGIDFINAFEDGNLLIPIANDFIWLDMYEREDKMGIMEKILIVYKKQIGRVCFVESLHFGSLCDILTGDN